MAKNTKKSPRTSETARYKRRMEEKQKKAEKSLINILRKEIKKVLNIDYKKKKQLVLGVSFAVIAFTVILTVGVGVFGRPKGPENSWILSKNSDLVTEKETAEGTITGTDPETTVSTGTENEIGADAGAGSEMDEGQGVESEEIGIEELSADQDIITEIDGVASEESVLEGDAALSAEEGAAEILPGEVAVEALPEKVTYENKLLNTLMTGPGEFLRFSDTRESILAKIAEKEAALQKEIERKNEEKKIQVPAAGCQVRIDGKVVAVLSSKIEADKLMEAVKNTYFQASNPKVKFLGYAENVEILEKLVEKSTIMTLEQATSMLLYGGEEVKIHVVKSGESVWLIARRNNMRVKDLEAANPGKNMELIHIGDELKLVSVKPLVSVKTQELMTITEAIPFTEKKENTSALYKDQKKIKVKGVNGKRVITADVIKVNGQITTKNVLTENILKAPKTQYVAIGTKAIPASFGTLRFRMPTGGKINTYFAQRGSLWGRERHRGIDIDGSVGNIVVAPDNGKVINTGYNSRSGNFITIDHGRGFVTFYAHLSKIGVRTGQVVTKGKYIGKVGNTGHSTGPHLHFEIRVNGTPVNPFRYIR